MALKKFEIVVIGSSEICVKTNIQNNNSLTLYLALRTTVQANNL